MKNNKMLCPDCGKPLEWMSSCVDGNKVISLCYCEECNNGLDKEWEVTYSKENGIEKN